MHLSPLRYPGGKSRAAKEIVTKYMPSGLSQICSPFVGGGSIELLLAQNGVNVYAYDSFAPLIYFWQELLNNKQKLIDTISNHQVIDSQLFKTMQKQIMVSISPTEIAAMFFILNRCSFSGSTMSGGMSKGHLRYNKNAILRLSVFEIKNNTLHVKEADFKESIKLHSNDFLYCDPPYLIAQKLYGTRGSHHDCFNHEALSFLLRNRDGWVLSYNNHAYIKDLYAGHHMTDIFWTYGMSKEKKSNEILIFSKDCNYLNKKIFIY